MSFFYSVFGLRLRANLLVPGLAPLLSPSATEIDIEVQLSPAHFSPIGLPLELQNTPQSIWYVSPDDGVPGEPSLTIWQLAGGASYRLSYSDGHEFLVDGEGTRIEGFWRESGTLEDAATYLLGPVLGFALRRRGITCLHASAVAMENRAVAFLGDSGAGKSTTAAAFARRGFPVLCDDVVAVLERESSLLVPAAYPYLCLWPDSVRLLYGSPDALPCLSSSWEKRQLALTERSDQFQREPLALGAVYVLGERTANPRAPYVESLPAQAALMTLVANTYANRILDKPMRAREFDLLSRLVSTVSVRLVQPHEDPARLETLCDLIRDDVRQVLTGRAARQSG